MKGRKANPKAKKDRQKCDFFKKGNPQKKINGAVKATKNSDWFFILFVFKPLKKGANKKNADEKYKASPFFNKIIKLLPFIRYSLPL